MPAFTIEHLEKRTLSDAWPLLRSASREPMIDWWEKEARQLLDRGGGVLAARAPDASIHGIATYECIHRPRTGSVLAWDARAKNVDSTLPTPIESPLRRTSRRVIMCGS